jgi:hypothetical protein
MEKIIIDLEAKTDKAVKEIEKLNKKVTELGEDGKKSLNKIEKSTGLISKSTKILSNGFKGVGLAMKAAGFAIIMKVVDKLGEAMMENQEIVDGLSAAFETVSIVMKQITTVFVDMFKSISDATGGFDALQKVLGGGLSIAVNLVAGTIQGLVLGVQKAQLAWEESFLGNGDPEEIKRLNIAIEETQEKLAETGERISEAGSQIAENFVEAVGEVGALAEGVAQATSDAIETIDVKQAISDGKRLAASKKNFERLAQEQQRLVEQYDLQAEQQRQIRDDESKSISEKIKANEELGRILLIQNEAEKKTVQARIDTLKEEERLKGTSIELSNEIYELQTEMIAIDAKVAGFKSEQLTNQISLQKENVELTNSQKESESQLGIERQRFNAELIEDELAKILALDEIDALEQEKEQERLQTIIDNENTGTQAKIDAQIALDEFKEQSRQTNLSRDKQIFELEKLRSKQTLSDAKSSFDQIANLAGKDSKIGKAMAIASATISGVEGVQNAYSTAQKSPITALFPGYPIVQAGLAGAVALKNISAIKSVKESGGGGTMPSPPSTPPTPSVPSLPPAFNVVGASDTNQLATAIGGQSQQPVQAYVVSNDVSTAQEMDRNIIEGASIG